MTDAPPPNAEQPENHLRDISRRGRAIGPMSDVRRARLSDVTADRTEHIRIDAILGY